MSDIENENIETSSERKPRTNGVKPSDWRIVLLGLYLLVLLLSSMYLIAGFMMAETVESAEKKAGQSAGRSDDKNATRTNQNSTGNAANANVNANSNTDTNVNNQDNTATNVSSNANVAASNTTSAANAKGNSNTNTNSNATNAGKNENLEITIPKEVRVRLFGGINDLTADGYVFWVVLLAGMLGAIVRCIFSYFRHLGIGDFSLSWTWFYLLLPYGGATLSLILYFVIRGGFYSSTVGKGLALNLFSFAALGALTGLFSENAMEKLKQTAEVLLEKVEPKARPSDQKAPTK